MEKQNMEQTDVDGINENFFNLLWTKDELNFGPSINIPDTIIFKYGQPVSWYFTTAQGKIKKKNRSNLLNARIEDSFTKNILGYDVIASYVSFPVTESGECNQTSAFTVEYFDRKEFQHFLYDRWESNNGILQKFVEPKTTHNEVIRAIWSPKVILLERSVNIHQLHDHRYGLYERCVTYEGPEFYSTSAPLRGPVLAGQIQKTCEAVVSHISEVTYAQCQISRLVLNFKVDSRDKLWLLFSTSIRSCAPPANFGDKPERNRSLLNIDNVLNLPKTVNLNPTRSYEHLKQKKTVNCVSCACETLEDLRHPINYKTIVKHYEHVLHLVAEMSDPFVPLKWPPADDIIQAAGGVGFGCLVLPSADEYLGKARKMDLTKPLETDELRIPPILRYLHPLLSAKSFHQCRKDPLFLYKNVTVCENCYLVYAEFTTMLLRVGQDLTKLFAKSDTSSYTGTYGGQPPSSVLNRPSSADWRAMSTISNKKGFQPSNRHEDAKDNSIGLRTSGGARSQPTLPSTIRDQRDSSTLLGSKLEGFSTLSGVDKQRSVESALKVTTPANNPNMSSNASEDDIRRMVADRERIFFKEISKNPQLRDQHPLMHLISSQQKLSLADEQSGILASKTSAQSESMFGSRYGSQADDEFDKYASYKEKFSFIGRSQSSTAAQQKKNRKSKKGGTNSSVGGGSQSMAAASTDGDQTEYTIDKGVVNSRAHREFLDETLKMVEGMEGGKQRNTEEEERAGAEALALQMKHGGGGGDDSLASGGVSNI
jgi:hypothetical protein